MLITNVTELHQTFETLGASVGRRRSPNRRTKDQKEWYCLRRYLLTLAGHDLLTYPFEIAKSERPDFLIDISDGRHGIEVTEATEEDWQRELTASEASEGDDPGDAEMLEGDVFAGEQPERDWCATVIRAINRKVDRLNDPAYPVTVCDLLVRAESRMSIVADEERAIELLAAAAFPELERWKSCARLQHVAILTHRHLLPDLSSGVEALSVTA
jgi:hypothetical protein